ncbi:LANO_0B03268g1_1 [Lachancea nothofagi CBS 11611]|uniref:LANO_0B03268g1_1 n=1 Tax=Lachancea nothofagi CBS 11611 TaxID=1266666 RepID=A0A1G4IX15_9SACH|nr:LANO_0B03268g1_1 [Lachancea nothofagi CBS 11611]
MNRVLVKSEDSRNVLPPETDSSQMVMMPGAVVPQPGFGVVGGGSGAHGIPVLPENLGNIPLQHPAVAAGPPMAPDSLPVLPPHATYHANNGMSDPSLQEYLSPFFQPYGVDVSHFPLTNPPIFQSSLTNFSDHPRRRRISISNGQISQLGDATHTFDDLYYSQPPPMPLRHDHKSGPGSKGYIYAQQPIAQIPPQSHPRPLPQTHSRPPPQPQSQLHSQPQSHPPSQSQSQPQAEVQAEPRPPQLLQHQQSAGTPLQSPPSNDYPSRPLSSDLDDDLDSKDSGPGGLYNHNLNSKEDHAHSMFSEHTLHPSYRQHGVVPGTPVWKRERLLERNRIAASKCRQRKKMAQQQLQKDVSLLAHENTEMRKRLQYFEKLVYKFKKFTEMHMASCGGSEQLSMIEELLKIDHNMIEDSREASLEFEDGKPQ